MQVLYFNEKVTHLDTVEIFYIYKKAAIDNSVTDTLFVPLKSSKLSSVRKNNYTTPPIPFSHSFPTHSTAMFPLPAQFPILTLGLQESVNNRHIF